MSAGLNHFFHNYSVHWFTKKHIKDFCTVYCIHLYTHTYLSYSQKWDSGLSQPRFSPEKRKQHAFPRTQQKHYLYPLSCQSTYGSPDVCLHFWPQEFTVIRVSSEQGLVSKEPQLAWADATVQFLGLYWRLRDDSISQRVAWFFTVV